MCSRANANKKTAGPALLVLYTQPAVFLFYPLSRLSVLPALASPPASRYLLPTAPPVPPHRFLGERR